MKLVGLITRTSWAQIPLPLRKKVQVRGLIRFHDCGEVFERFDLANVKVFAEQAAAFKAMLGQEPPSDAQSADTDWLLTLGEIFTLVVYAQLALENAEIYGLEDDLVDQIFGVAVRDLSGFAVELHGKAATTPKQGKHIGCGHRRLLGWSPDTT